MEDNKTTRSHSPNNKTLPSFEKGGLVVFLHIPKTGGTTLRLNLMQQSDILNYIFVAGAGLYNNSKPVIQRYLTTNTNRKRKTIFLEIHGRDSPHLLELQDTLKEWKELAHQFHHSIFYFTILREPISYAVSYFNFFHVQRKNPHFDQVPATEANLLRYSLYHPQCQFLARGEYSLRQTIKQQPSLQECEQVYQTFLDSMDWIGTTERMTEETLRLVQRLLPLPDNFAFPPQLVSSKLGHESLSLQDLSPSTVSKLEAMSTFDRDLYHNATQTFRLDDWKDLISQN
jgi:hypothetical protein